jgi:type VI secretion system protein ImpH
MAELDRSTPDVVTPEAPRPSATPEVAKPSATPEVAKPSATPEVAKPAAFDPLTASLYAALRHLEVVHRDAPRLGEAKHLAEERVRLGQDPTLVFEARAVTSFEPEGDGKPARLHASILGVWGANGPLPLHMTEEALRRIRHGADPTLARFADIFHHRFLSMFYRVWANAQPTVEQDRPQHNRFSTYVGAAIGRADPPRGPHDAVLDRFTLYMACHFARQTRCPEGLQKLVSSYFEVPAEIEEFVGEWLDVPEEYCWRLGRNPSSGATGLGRLGLGTRAGRRIWERQGKFRIVLGPLDRERYERLLPGGQDVPALVQLVRSYVGLELSWEVRLLLREPDRRPLRLGVARLGLTTHLVGGLDSRTDPQPSTDSRRWSDLTYTPSAALS